MGDGLNLKPNLPRPYSEKRGRGNGIANPFPWLFARG